VFLEPTVAVLLEKQALDTAVDPDGTTRFFVKMKRKERKGG